MRIVVSGTHASGKSTLIADFAARHPGFEVLPDPFEDLGDAVPELDAGVFFEQLMIAARRLRKLPDGARVIAERGPLDFLAYLRALDDLSRPGRSTGLLRRAESIVAETASCIDLIALLPLPRRNPVPVGDDEDPELRDATDAALLDLIDDPDLIGEARTVELAGSPEQRLAQLEAARSR